MDAHAHCCADHSCTLNYSLYKHINLPGVTCLNALSEDVLPDVFRPWESRLSHPSSFLRSDPDDPELLLTIPFTTNVTILAVAIICPEDSEFTTYPDSVRVFTNRENMDFQTAQEAPPVQSWDLLQDYRAQTVAEYTCKPGKFVGVHTLTMHFPSSYGADETNISFIGFKGTASGVVREAPKNLVYESQPTPEDAGKAPDELRGGMNMGM
eukprot:CAMPEP_0119196860 /NCGR_PEP_ID=MMETSP1316-20130426/11822_1 /TAXON_ID=41880 /ORGANISM="Pycnococcus provasolii, Strain RCC2336" /LENGTH=209 /DNA_ID=CAMNT_0007192599 /DNA_START=132 /DNA_END=761 /DNA_ORIENTATION=+